MTSMLRLRLHFLLRNKQTRLILLLTLCLSLLISSIGLFSYSRYRQELDSELNIPNIELLQINLDVTNRAFRQFDNLAVDASFQPDVLRNMNDTNENGTASSNLRSYLQTLSSTEGISSIQLIRFADETVLSSDHKRQSWQQAPDNTWMDSIRQVQRRPLLIQRRWQGRDAAQGNTMLLSLARPVVVHGQVRGAVLVNLDYDRFFSNFYVHLSSAQMVYDLDGRLIYPKQEQTVDDHGMDQVLQTLGVQPYAYVQLNGQDYMANQSFSDVTGWRLVSLVPMEELLKHVRLARNMMLLLSAISIVIGCGVMYYYSYAAFRPLRRISTLLQPEQEHPRRTSLHELEHMIGRLVGDAHSKDVLAERSLPELQSKYVQDILHKHIGSRDIRAKWEQYFANWQPAPLYIVMLSIDRYAQWARQYSEDDRTLLHYALHNLISEILRPHWRLVIVGSERDQCIVLIQPDATSVQESDAAHTASAEQPAAHDYDREYDSDHEQAYEQQLQPDLYDIIAAARQHLRISLSAGIGTQMQSVQEVSISCETASQALARRLYAGYGQVHTYTANTASSLPAEQEWRDTLITLSEQDDIHSLLPIIRNGWNEIVQTHPAPERVYPRLYDLLERLVTAAVRLQLHVPDEWTYDPVHLLSTLELDEIIQQLEQLLHELEQHSTTRRTSREQMIIQTIRDYMQQHLDDNIGLPDIAEQVQLSVSSVSQLFKEQTGSTIYDYLTRLRIDHACELLRHTNLKIADIAHKVGYQNENSFIRTFRKYKFTTPGKYREQH
ncbi:AraC family transcriptional regulator [Paenibacillus sp. WLX1005]|uniref:AraC family transcriptional regulator n=1 Tax=Paenibacillus sp. WLX1005 TaxID=3243766 RepID=UPI0039843AFC